MMLPLSALAALLPLLTVGQADGLATMQEASRLASGLGDAAQRATLLLRGAELSAQADQGLAVTLLLRGLTALPSEDRAARDTTSRALVVLGAEPLEPTLAPLVWRTVARERALAAIYRLDPKAALALTDSLVLPDAERIRLLASAAQSAVGDGMPLTGTPYSPDILAGLALERALAMDPTDESLVRLATEAVIATDSAGGASLLTEAGPIRALAARLLVERAPSAAAALAASTSLLDPAQRCAALLARAKSEPDPGARATLAGAARDAAGLVPHPAREALALAGAAVACAASDDPAPVAEQAHQAALLVTSPSARVETLAGVAGLLAPIAPETARAALEEALALTRAIASKADRAEALHGIAVSIAATLAGDATRIASGFGEDRLNWRIDVLVAIASQAPATERAGAIRPLLKALKGWQASPGDKLRELNRATLRPVPPERVAALWAPKPAKAPPIPPGVIPPDGPAAPIEPPGEPAEPAGPPAPPADGLALAEQEARAYAGELLLERAERLTGRAERIAALVAAAEWSSAYDAKLTTKTLGAAMDEIEASTVETGWLEVLLTRASALSPDLALALARRVREPGCSVRALVACGACDEALAVARKQKDPWVVARLTVDIVTARPSPEALDAVQQALGALPPGDKRDSLLRRAVPSALGSGLPGAWDAVRDLTALSSMPATLALVRIEAARQLLTEGDAEAARSSVADAERLMDECGRLEDCLAALAPVKQTLGEDGLALARGLANPGLRARALTEVAGVLLTASR
jgi:hypothetical protein